MTVFDSEGNIYEDLTNWHLGNSTDREQGPFDTTLTSDEPKKIYFVRHGDTDLNKESSESSNEQPVRGWSLIPLNQDGIKQAQKAAESVKDLPITHIESSDLPRARQTANIIGNRLDITPEFNPGLRTWNLGEFTGKAGKEVHDEVNRLCSKDQDEAPKGGESFNQFKDRILSTMSDIVNKHKDHELLVVSHNSPERVLHAWTEAGQPQKETENIFDKIKGFFQNPAKPDTSINLSEDPKLVHPGMGFTLPKEAAFAADKLNPPLEALKKFISPMVSMGLENKDEFDKSIEAMKRSPVSQLGFAPDKSFITRDAKETNIAGTYRPDKDIIWSNALYNTNLIHESMHRGLEILQKEGLIPKKDQEMIVRRLMYKHFGNVESKHGESGKREMEAALSSLSDSDVSKIEKIASDHYKKLHPGLKDGQ